MSLLYSAILLVFSSSSSKKLGGTTGKRQLKNTLKLGADVNKWAHRGNLISAGLFASFAQVPFSSLSKGLGFFSLCVEKTEGVVYCTDCKHCVRLDLVQKRDSKETPTNVDRVLMSFCVTILCNMFVYTFAGTQCLSGTM